MTDLMPDLESQLERYGAVLRDELATPAPPVPMDRRDRSRSRVVLAAAAVVFAVIVSAAVVVSHVHSTETRTTSNATSTSTSIGPAVDPNKVAAEARAAQLLTLVRPGPGWTAVTTAPAPILTKPFEQPGTPALVQSTRFWVAPAPWSAVDQAVQDQPADLHSIGSGSTSDHGVTTARGYDFLPSGFPPDARIRQQWVRFETAPLADGRIGIRADAQVIWVPSRPTDEVVPAGFPAVTVTATWGSGGPRQRLSRTFGDRATIDGLARTVNGLQVADPGVHGCTMDANLRLTLHFNRPLEVDSVTTVSDPACGDTSFTRDGKSGAALATGPTLLDQLAHLLGTSMQALDARAMAAATVPPPTTPTTA